MLSASKIEDDHENREYLIPIHTAPPLQYVLESGDKLPQPLPVTFDDPPNEA